MKTTEKTGGNAGETAPAASSVPPADKITLETLSALPFAAISAIGADDIANALRSYHGDTDALQKDRKALNERVKALPHKAAGKSQCALKRAWDEGRLSGSVATSIGFPEYYESKVGSKPTGRGSQCSRVFCLVIHGIMAESEYDRAAVANLEAFSTIIGLVVEKYGPVAVLPDKLADEILDAINALKGDADKCRERLKEIKARLQGKDARTGGSFDPKAFQGYVERAILDHGEIAVSTMTSSLIGIAAAANAVRRDVAKAAYLAYQSLADAWRDNAAAKMAAEFDAEIRAANKKPQMAPEQTPVPQGWEKIEGGGSHDEPAAPTETPIAPIDIARRLTAGWYSRLGGEFTEIPAEELADGTAEMAVAFLGEYGRWPKDEAELDGMANSTPANPYRPAPVAAPVAA